MESRSTRIRKAGPRRRRYYRRPLMISRAPRYNGDYYTKVQSISGLFLDAGGQANCQLRFDGSGSNNFLKYLFDQPEFTAIQNTFGMYEVIGVKMTVSMNNFTDGAAKAIGGIFMWSGQASNVPVSGPYNLDRLNYLEHNKQGTGTVSLYQPIATELRRANAYSSVATGAVPNAATAQSYCIVSVLNTQGFAAGDEVGSYTCVWYIKMSGRRGGF